MNGGKRAIDKKGSGHRTWTQNLIMHNDGDLVRTQVVPTIGFPCNASIKREKLSSNKDLVGAEDARFRFASNIREFSGRCLLFPPPGQCLAP